MSESEVVIENRGACGVATLNRPAALNALTHGMIRTLSKALDAFERDASVASVVLRGAGGRAFCAGADIRALYEHGKARRRDDQIAFFRDEYDLDRRIARFSKPIVALVDGVVMGGGAGLSVNARHCVAGDKIVFAMPEVGIGFFPDVGATSFLPRSGVALAAYLALTAARIGTGDMLALRLATAYVPSARHDALLERLGAGEALEAAIGAESAPPPPAALDAENDLIERCFSAPSVGAIAERLAGEPSDFARAALEAMRVKSPTSLAVALRQMRMGAGLELEDALRIEFRIAARILDGHDYYEGVRAVIVDKDHKPQWRPAGLDAPTPAEIDAYFAPLEEELAFTRGAAFAG